MSKRIYTVRVEVDLIVELPLPDGDEFENCCDPDGEMTDSEAIESAVTTAIRGCQVFVYGQDREPAKVFIDHTEIHIEGFEDDE